MDVKVECFVETRRADGRVCAGEMEEGIDRIQAAVGGFFEGPGWNENVGCSRFVSFLRQGC